MEKAKKKILKRVLCLATVLIAGGGAIVFSTGKIRDNTVAVMGGAGKELPVIVLDAGHGECS